MNACNLDAKLGSCGDKQKDHQEHSALRRKRQEQDGVLTTQGEVWVGEEEKELWAEASCKLLSKLPTAKDPGIIK